MPTAPSVFLSEIGEIAEKYIKNIDSKYENVSVDKRHYAKSYPYDYCNLKMGRCGHRPYEYDPTEDHPVTEDTGDKEAGISIFQKSYHT
jgi:hypothetical protein